MIHLITFKQSGIVKTCCERECNLWFRRVGKKISKKRKTFAKVPCGKKVWEQLIWCVMHWSVLEFRKYFSPDLSLWGNWLIQLQHFTIRGPVLFTPGVNAQIAVGWGWGGVGGVLHWHITNPINIVARLEEETLLVPECLMLMLIPRSGSSRLNLILFKCSFLPKSHKSSLQ